MSQCALIPPPAAAVLALAELALDLVDADPWTRLYVYAFSVS